MRFEWDERKNASNLRKHDVGFEFATAVFDDPLAFSEQDRIVDGEERWWTIGNGGGRILYVAFTVDESGDEDIVRIISARRATRQERRDYEQGTRATHR
ncbi:MAG: BrnT family toxin [Chloroflexia bacterium]|nr:BrnT family toxin [Chloroflexia bacterium]